SDEGVQSVNGPYRIMDELSFADFGGNGARIGCVDTSIAKAIGPNRPIAELKNALGQYVGPTTDSVTRALALMKPNTDGTYSVVMREHDGFTDAQAYSMPIVSYAIVPKNLDAATRSQAVAFLNWVITVGQQADHLPAGYVPLPAPMVATAKAQI